MSNYPMNTYEISDRMEIQHLLTQYCHAVDEPNWDSFGNLFTEDAVLDFSAFGGPRCGVTEMATFLSNIVKDLAGSQHTISTSLLHLNGEIAEGRTAAQVMLVSSQNDGTSHVSFFGLWYLDTLIKTPGGWRIKERVQKYAWVHNMPST